MERFKLSKFFHLNHLITGAYWDADRGHWEIRVKDLLSGHSFIDICDVFISCSGILKSEILILSMLFLQVTDTFLSAWDWPKIKGLKSFKGKLCHTADYDESTELKGKKVAVIGIGSSGVQVIPNILEKVDHLYCWIRSPTWMTAGFAQKFAGPNGANYKCEWIYQLLSTAFITHHIALL